MKLYTGQRLLAPGSAHYFAPTPSIQAAADFQPGGTDSDQLRQLASEARLLMGELRQHVLDKLPARHGAQAAQLGRITRQVEHWAIRIGFTTGDIPQQVRQLDDSLSDYLDHQLLAQHWGRLRETLDRLEQTPPPSGPLPALAGGLG